MTCPFNKESLAQLKSFVDLVKGNGDLLHASQLSFFKEYIESLGGTVPEPKQHKPMPKTDETTAEGPAPAAEDVEAQSDSESELEFDTECCIEADSLSDTQVMGDAEKQPTEEESDKADEVRSAAMKELSGGNFEKAVELFSEAIIINPQSAILFTKRGQSYIKLNRPNACIKDCTHALVLNCDSALAYKFRGRAYRLLGDWEKAAQDLRQACKIDFDEQADEWLKEVQPNALKIEQHKLKQERKKLDKAETEKLERIKKAREAHAKAAETNAEQPMTEDADAGGQPGMGDFYKLMQDPEVLAALQDPEVAAAFEDISTNPSNIIKYQSNPKVQALIEKLFSKFSKGGGMGFPGFGFPGGFPPGGAGAGAATPQDDGLD